MVQSTNQVLVAAVDGEVAQGDGHGSDHLVGVGAQQLHQDGETFLLAHRGSDVIGPLEGQAEHMLSLFPGFFLDIITFNTDAVVLSVAAFWV